MILKKTSIFTILSLIPCISLYFGNAVADTCDGKGWYRWEETSTSKDWCMPCPAGCYCDENAEKKKIFTGGSKWKDCSTNLTDYGIYSCGSGYTSDSTTTMCTGLGKQSYCRGPQSTHDCYFISTDTQKTLYRGSLSITCNPGTYTKAKHEKCQSCKTGYLCPGGVFYTNKRHERAEINSQWSSSWKFEKIDLTRSPIKDDGIYLCPSGTEANSNHTKCVSKSSSSNSSNNNSKKNYTCKAGQYLPANATSCSQCRDRYYCPGGTFELKSFDQGLKSCAYNKKPNQNQTGCEDSSVYCDAGQYLPANSDSCVICKDKSYVCGGGRFYPESFDQGINNCDNGYAPNDEKTQCVYVADIDYHCDAGYYLPAYGTKCERCPSSKKYCPGGTFQYYDLDQGIYTCPYTSVSNSERSACVLRLSQDYMKYGPNGENTPLSDQCWTKKKREPYKKCIYSEKAPKNNQFLLKKPLANVGILDNIIDIKNTNRSLPMATPEDKASKFRNAPVVIEKDSVVQALLDSAKK